MLVLEKTWARVNSQRGKAEPSSSPAWTVLTVLRGGKGGPRTGRVISSNLPEHPISSRDSGSSMGPVGGTSAEKRGCKVGGRIWTAQPGLATQTTAILTCRYMSTRWPLTCSLHGPARRCTPRVASVADLHPELAALWPSCACAEADACAGGTSGLAALSNQSETKIIRKEARSRR